MDAFLQRKWTHVFNVFFDANRSETLEWNDFELLVEQIRQKRGESEYGQALQAMRVIWDGLVQYDVDRDNKISIEEWHIMWKTIVNGKQEATGWQNAYLEYMFKLLDASGDKLIDKREYTDVMGLYGMAADDAQRAFDSFAKAPVDFATFGELWKDYFESTDPRSPGNHLFGPVNA